MVTMVLLKVELTCAVPVVTFLRSFLRALGAAFTCSFDSSFFCSLAICYSILNSIISYWRASSFRAFFYADLCACVHWSWCADREQAVPCGDAGRGSNPDPSGA